MGQGVKMADMGKLRFTYGVIGIAVLDYLLTCGEVSHHTTGKSRFRQKLYFTPSIP